MFFSELADALKARKHKLALYVAHDTSLIRLAAGLEMFPLRWPRLGSEIVIEVCAHTYSGPSSRQLMSGILCQDLER